MKNEWEHKGYEGCDNAFDLGWKHGTEDIASSFNYHPDIELTKDDWDDYKEGYKEARKGWD